MLIAVIPLGFTLPLPATASAEGAQLNGSPSLREKVVGVRAVCLSVHPYYCNVPLRARQALFSLRYPYYVSQARPSSGDQASIWSSARVGVCWHASSCVHTYCSASSMCSRTCSAYSLLLRLVAKSAATNWASAAQLASMMYVSRCSIDTRYLTRSSPLRSVRIYLDRLVIRCTVSEVGCQIKMSTLLTRTSAVALLR